MIVDLKDLGDFAAVALESDAIAFVACHIDGRILTCNNAFYSLTGYSKADLNYMKWPDSFTPAAQRRYMYSILSSLRCGDKSPRHEKISVRKDGSTLLLEFFVHKLCDANGKPLCYYSFLADISDRRQAEEEIARFSALIRSSGDAIFCLSLDGTIESWNPAAEKIYGYRADEIIGCQLSVLMHQDRPFDLCSVLDEIRHRADIVKFDTTYPGKDGRTIDLAVTTAPIFNTFGVITGISLTARDITDRKRNEDLLRQKERDLSTLVDNIPGYAFFKDVNSKVVYANQKFCDSVGLSREEVIGKYTDQLGYPKELAEKYIADDKRIIATGEALYTEEEFVDLGRRFIVGTRKVPLKDNHGKIMGLIGLAMDITELKQTEEALNDARAQSDMYLDLMGHDINNMNQIASGFLELALNTLDLDDPGRELIERPLEALESSTKLIRNVKKLQKTKGEGLQLHRLNVERVLREVIPNFSSIPGRQITITKRFDCDCPVMANGLINDVFSNILGNAIKHSTGALSIDVGLKKVVMDGIDYCQVSIEDDGPGICDEMKQEILRRFDQGKVKMSGKGLGLYLVRTLVDDFRGKVWVEDRVPGDYTKGTRFVIILPAIH